MGINFRCRRGPAKYVSVGNIILLATLCHVTDNGRQKRETKKSDTNAAPRERVERAEDRGIEVGGAQSELRAVSVQHAKAGHVGTLGGKMIGSRRCSYESPIVKELSSWYLSWRPCFLSQSPPPPPPGAPRLVLQALLPARRSPKIDEIGAKKLES